MRNTSKMFLGMALVSMMFMSYAHNNGIVYSPTEMRTVFVFGMLCIMLFVAVPEKE